VAPAAAIARGVVQLAIISLILGGIITQPALIAVALLVMFGVAVSVATQRIGWSRHGALVMSTSIAAGIAVAGAAVFDPVRSHPLRGTRWRSARSSSGTR
jgi:putative ABC transport system permease protein